jgi:hypothetical protein
MANQDSVTAKLAAAKSTLEKANKFQASTGGPMYHPASAPHAAPAPVPHEFSRAPYSLVNKAKEAFKKATGPTEEAIHEASDTAAGIKSRMENAKAVQ